MPTSGEARIHTTSSYNLRSKPLPKTRQALANKENVQKPATANSRIPQRKSKLPVKSTSRKPPVSTSDKKKSQTRVRTVPNFEKLHKNWQKKFQQGKAVTKKPCTQSREFDLTRPGTHFKRAYFSGDEHTDTEDEFQADQDALQSILDNRGLGNDAITGRSTVATMGGSRQTTHAPEHRQTLGALPTHYSGRVNSAYNMPSAAKMPRHATGFTSERMPRHAAGYTSERMPRHAAGYTSERSKQRKKSLIDEQCDADIEFEEDNDALATILNDTGVQPARDYSTMTRQTIASTHARTYQRTSIYYQKPKEDNKNKVYADFARLTIGGTVSPTVLKLRDFAASQTLPRNFAASTAQPSNLQRAALLNNAAAVGRPTPGHSVSRPKTPGTASRVVNTRFQKAQELSCSPALRVSNKPCQPRSALRMPNTHNRGGRNVCWAEILDSPSDKAVPIATKDELATALFADEEAQFGTSYSMAQKQQQELNRIQADTSSNRHKVEEMEAVELQLQMEIERLQREAEASSIQTSVPSNSSVPLPQQQQQQQQQQILPGVMLSNVPSQLQHHGQHVAMSMIETNSGLMSSTLPRETKRLGQDNVQPSSISQVQNPHGGNAYPTHAVPQSFPGSSQSLRTDIQIQQGPITGSHPSAATEFNSLPFRYDLSQQSPGLHIQQNFHAEVAPVADHLQVNYQAPSAPNYQFQQSSGIQRHGVVTSGPQQRPVVNFNSAIGYSSFQGQQGPMHNSSQLGFQQIEGNQRVETFVVERPPAQSISNGSIGASTHPSASFSQVGGMAISSQAIETKSAHHKAHFQGEAKNRVMFQPSLLPAERSEVHRPSQSVLQPSLGGLQTSRAQNTMQANEFSLGSLPTVYGMPADLAKINTTATVSSLSSMPTMSAFVGESPLQPSYMTKSAIDPKSSLIQTPHPVKPENHFKHQVMKRYTPAVQSTQRAVIDMPVPIQTPMAMRNAMLQGQMSGIKGRLVSPVAQIPTPVALKTTTIDSNPLRYPDQFNSSSTASEPKLKLDFENVEDTPSVELLHNIPKPTRPTVVPELSTSTTNSAVQSRVVRTNGQVNDPLAPGMRLKGQWNKNLAGQLFHETLLDEECALYTCRLQGKFAPKPIVDRNYNPIAKVLMEGDDMHFVPITSGFATGTVTPAGSAFNTYATWT